MPAETPLIQEKRHQLEVDVIRSVRGKDQTMKSSWVAGYGPILKKKDRVPLSLTQEQSVGRQRMTFLESNSSRSRNN